MKNGPDPGYQTIILKMKVRPSLFLQPQQWESSKRNPKEKNKWKQCTLEKENFMLINPIIPIFPMHNHSAYLLILLPVLKQEGTHFPVESQSPFEEEPRVLRVLRNLRVPGHVHQEMILAPLPHSRPPCHPTGRKW